MYWWVHLIGDAAQVWVDFKSKSAAQDYMDSFGPVAQFKMVMSENKPPPYFKT